MNELKTQAAKVLELLTNPSTGTTFQNAFSLAWQILKEVGQLLWLVLCLGLVFVEWLWKTGYSTGWKTRDWVNTLDQPGRDRVFNETGKSLLELGKTSATKAVASAKERLGIVDTGSESPVVPPAPKADVKPPAVKPPAVKSPTPEPAVVTSPAPSTVAAEPPKSEVE
ncbi:MAG: hypothetical protein ACKO24_12465 [Leptolyngbyaceae cyanobacterium]